MDKLIEANRRWKDVLGNVMLNFNRAFGKHKLDALLLGEAQQRVMSGFHTTVTNFTTDKFGFHNLQAGAVRLWEVTALIMRILVWHLF